MKYAEGKAGGGAVKQTHGYRTQPINGSQNKQMKVKLNERNANSWHHHSNSHSCGQSKSPYVADLGGKLFKALSLKEITNIKLSFGLGGSVLWLSTLI